MSSIAASDTTVRTTVEAWMRDFQNRLCAKLEETDGGASFHTDAWDHPQRGGGYTRVLQNGNILEKGGVAFSAVWGEMSAAAAQHLLMPDPSFFATGVSVVMHPRSPRQPIAHMNVRYFEAGNGDAWFGGGLDLTPIYVDKQQAQHFHRRIYEVCQRHNPSYYPQFKQWADDYFYLPHRQETRGVGGIFFDLLTVGEDGSFEDLFAFVQDVGNLFGAVYSEIMMANRHLPFTEAQKQWQLIRRGRYAEFNLAIDRGTKFGLETNGATESSLMSLPPQAEWYYNRQPEPGTPEATTQAWLRKDVDWLS